MHTFETFLIRLSCLAFITVSWTYFKMKLISNHYCSATVLCMCLCGYFFPQESEGGLYVCMNTFLGFGREHVERHYRKTGQSVYMHLKRHVKEVRKTTGLIFHFSLVWLLQSWFLRDWHVDLLMPCQQDAIIVHICAEMNSFKHFICRCTFIHEYKVLICGCTSQQHSSRDGEKTTKLLRLHCYPVILIRSKNHEVTKLCVVKVK